MKSLRLAFVSLSLLLFALPPAAEAKTPPADLTVYTRNLYLGANLPPLALAKPGEEFERAVSTALGEVDATEPKERMKLVAREIAAADADFVNLQEACRWLTAKKSEPTRLNLRYDYVSWILKELRRLGRSYRVATSILDLKIANVPTDQYFNLTLELGNAILVRKGIDVDAARSGNFKEQFAIETQAIGTVETTRAWNLVDFTVGGRRGRLVNAHPEAYLPQTRLAQVKELIAGPLKSSRPVILAGDLNTGPDLPKEEDRPPYQALAKAGFVDRRTPKLNCCFNDDLKTGTWDHIVDRIMTRPAMRLIRSGIQGNSARTPSGLYTADHGSVHSTLRLP